MAGGGTMCSEAQVTGVTKDGGFAEYMLAPAVQVSVIPEGIDFAEAAPLMCAGLTVHRGLVNADFKPGEKVAVIGIGGLGHLAIRYARAMGGRVAAISRSPKKEPLAKEMGVELFIDGNKPDFVEKLRAWDGGADIILATAPSAKEMNASFPGLARKGRLVVLGLTEEEVKIKPMDIIIGERKVVGSLIGTRHDIQDCLSFSITHGIRAEIETFNLEDAGKALEALRSGNLKGRAVIVMD